MECLFGTRPSLPRAAVKTNMVKKKKVFVIWKIFRGLSWIHCGS